jgi:hypothetical protein
VDNFYYTAEEFTTIVQQKLALAHKINNMAVEIFAEAISKFF